jgi:hypothetical protein
MSQRLVSQLTEKTKPSLTLTGLLMEGLRPLARALLAIVSDSLGNTAACRRSFGNEFAQARTIHKSAEVSRLSGAGGDWLREIIV